jgi:hypothetical protein
MKTMVFLTWTERRAWLKGYGKPVAALWIREATHDDVVNAHRYAAQEREGGTDHQVHVFEYIDNFAEAKRKALAAHRMRPW